MEAATARRAQAGDSSTIWVPRSKGVLQRQPVRRSDIVEQLMSEMLIPGQIILSSGLSGAEVDRRLARGL